MHAYVFLVLIFKRMRDPVQCAFNPLPEPDWLNPAPMRIRSNRIRCGQSQSGFNADRIWIECLMWTGLKSFLNTIVCKNVRNTANFE